MPVYRLPKEHAFPDPGLARSDGLLAVGGDLSPNRLLLAYSMGIFPWYNQGEPILWWSPSPRLVLFPQDFHASRSLKKALRQGRFTLTADQAFARVISHCAQARSEGTWITTDMEKAYLRLHEMGFAHSVEAWSGEELAGGLYGVSLGRCFFGESMFYKKPDASKAALAALADFCIKKDFSFIDCQVVTPHMLSLGARTVSRFKFLSLLTRALEHPGIQGPWDFSHVNPARLFE